MSEEEFNDAILNASKRKDLVDGQKQDYEDIEVRMTATKVLVDNQFFK